MVSSSTVARLFLSGTLFLAQSSLAHTKLFGVVGGKNCLRPTSDGNNPIKDVSAPDMTCGKGETKAEAVCDVKAGGKVSLQFGHNSAADDVVAASHVGPCNVYLAASKNGEKAPTDGWFKIYEENFKDGKWCTMRVKDGKGILEVPIPEGVAAGSYVMRSELLALHEGNQKGKSQFYVFCAELDITGDGDGEPGEMVKIPGHFTADTPGVLFDAYQGGAGEKFPTIGPKVASLASSGKKKGKKDDDKKKDKDDDKDDDKKKDKDDDKKKDKDDDKKEKDDDKKKEKRSLSRRELDELRSWSEEKIDHIELDLTAVPDEKKLRSWSRRRLNTNQK